MMIEMFDLPSFFMYLYLTSHALIRGLDCQKRSRNGLYSKLPYNRSKYWIMVRMVKENTMWHVIYLTGCIYISNV